MKNPMSVNEHININYRVCINNIYIYNITYYCYFYYDEQSCGLDHLVQ